MWLVGTRSWWCPCPEALRCSGDALGAFWAMQVMLCPLRAGAFHEWDTRSISRTTWAVVSSVVWEFFVLGFWRMEPVSGGLSSGFAN